MLCVIEAILMSTLNIPLVWLRPQWLELTMSRTNFHGPKDVRASEVRLNFLTLRLIYIISNEGFWVASEYISSDMCSQRRVRSACAFAQSDQILRRGAYIEQPRMQSLFVRTRKNLIILHGCAGWFESLLGCLRIGDFIFVVFCHCFFISPSFFCLGKAVIHRGAFNEYPQHKFC